MARRTQYHNYPTGGGAVMTQWDMGNRQRIYNYAGRPEPTSGFQVDEKTPVRDVCKEIVIRLKPMRDVARSKFAAIKALRIISHLEASKLRFSTPMDFFEMCSREARTLQLSDTQDAMQLIREILGSMVKS